MIKIKSQQALEYLHGTSNEKEFLNMADLLPLCDAIKAVIIAEQEAEERHTKQLQELNDRAVDAFKYSVCQSCTLQCTEDCRLMCYFIQKLTKKQ